MSRFVVRLILFDVSVRYWATFHREIFSLQSGILKTSEVAMIYIARIAIIYGLQLDDEP